MAGGFSGTAPEGRLSVGEEQRVVANTTAMLTAILLALTTTGAPLVSCPSICAEVENLRRLPPTMQTGGTPVLTAPPSNTNLAFACLLTAGRRAVDGAVYDVRQMAQEAAWTAGHVTWRAFLTGRYIWDTQLRPALSGAAQESYQIFLRDAASCDATAARYVCSSLSAYFNMQ